MGRGSGRTKASGGALSQDALHTDKQLSLNMTLFQFLQTGYFEKDLLTYCSNRLAEYSCIYWLDPKVEGNIDAIELRTVAYSAGSLNTIVQPVTEATKYPSHFINQNVADIPAVATATHTLVDGDPIKGTFLGPVNIRQVIFSETGSALATVESSRLPVNTVARIVLPFLLLLACIASWFILYTNYKLSLRRLPVAVYFVYLSLFDLLDLVASGTDYLVEAYNGIRLFTATLFLGRTTCQLLPLAHSAIHHVHASLLIGLSIDTCRLTMHTERFKSRFRREWTRNVFILSCVVAIMLDSQFLWTFDLSLLETKVLHERMVHNAYECSITQTSSPLFLHYIWPITDHLWGDILPCVVCGIAGIVGLTFVQKRKKRIESTALMKTNRAVSVKRCYQTQLADRVETNLIKEAIQAFSLVSITNGIFIIPRLTFYLTKYELFSSYQFNQAGTFWSSYDLSYMHPILQAMENVQERITQWRQYEASLEGVESFLRYLGAVNIVTNALILACTITENRRRWGTYFFRIQRWFSKAKARYRAGFASKQFGLRMLRGRPGEATNSCKLLVNKMKIVRINDEMRHGDTKAALRYVSDVFTHSQRTANYERALPGRSDDCPSFRTNNAKHKIYEL